MKHLRKILAATVMVGVLTTAQYAYASPTLCYYSFNMGPSGQVSSSTFTVTNSLNKVSISGTQTCGTTGCSADVYYYLKKQSAFFDDTIGTQRVNTSGYYSREYTGVATGSGYYIYIKTNSYSTSGSGNAYDGD